MNEHKIIEELIKIRQSIKRLEHHNSSLCDWWSKRMVMDYFNYGETQLRQLEKEHKLVISKIRARKFYSVQSILNLIEGNKTNK
jgi:hypothetical protein